MGPMIDMDKVSNMVADMDGEIPDRAKGLMTAITSMQKVRKDFRNFICMAEVLVPVI